jgi:hypothetical protein
MLSYSLGYSAPGVNRSAAGRVPCDLVGVAGFEPAASSSQSKSSGYALIWASPDRGYSPSPAQTL